MKKRISLSFVSLLVAGVTTAQAATLDTTSAGPPNDGVLQNFTSIDWNANAAGWIQGFDLPNVTGATDDFMLTYQAFAGTLGTTSAFDYLRVASPANIPGTYELTTVAIVNETVTCLAAGIFACQSVSIAATGGNWTIYFDTTAGTFANPAAGTGYTEGVAILAGTWDSGLSSFASNGIPPGFPGAEGSGGGYLEGTVTSTNNAYVNPDLIGSTIQSSLFFPGQAPPTYVRPALINGVAVTPDTPTDFVLQTDTSQDFTAVPEPSSIVLAGVGLLAFGLSKRARKASPTET